jgi:regulator of CtrA degradation
MIATVFLDRTYHEACDLLLEAHDYLVHKAPLDRSTLTPEGHLILECESLRLTSLLTAVMAWLLVQRAVSAGEISAEQAASAEHRLANHGVCTGPELYDKSAIPPALCRLLDRSFNLYRRLDRLDHMMASAR